MSSRTPVTLLLVAALALASPGFEPAFGSTSSPNPASSSSAGDEPPSRGELFARWNALRGDPYELDSIERFVDSEAKRPRIECNPESMVAYSGSTIRYSGAVRVNAAFQVRLQRFEDVAAEVGTEIYGRPPRRIRHYGAYVCRSSRQRSHRVSEHALGNAIDIVGFDFGGLPKAEALPEDVPRGLRGPFQVRVAQHWKARANPTAQTHQRFLRELTARLEERTDVFRILIGPGHGNHADHFHFDVSPWRYVDL